MLNAITVVCTLFHLTLQIQHSALYNIMLQFLLHVYEITILLFSTSAFEVLKQKVKNVMRRVP